MAQSKVKLSTDHVLKGLDHLRDQKLLCDVELVAEGATFPAHRVVLAAAAPKYFQAMFTGGFKENQMNEITLNETSAEGLKCLLDAIYTGELSLTEGNVCDILPVASQLQLDEIVKHCETFLVDNVSAENCLTFLAVAEKYDLQKAVDECNKILLDNFDTISESTEFTKLSKEQLCSCLSDDQLKVHNGEIEVFRATLKWYEANQGTNTDVDSSGLVDLMQHVRFPLIPSDILLDEILTSRLISENGSVMRMVTEALKFHADNNIFLQPLQKGKQFQRRGEDMLALVESTTISTGQSWTVPRTKLHLINATGDDPFYAQLAKQVLPVTLCPGSFSLIATGNFLFLFGAETKYWREIALRFDVSKSVWLDLKAPPIKVSTGTGATLLKGNIYLLGGMHVTKDKQNSFKELNSFSGCDLSASASQYSIETNSWSTLQHLPKPLVGHSTASHGDYVFSAGGCTVESNSTIPTNRLYAYDVVGKIWLSKSSMNNRRVRFGMEAIGATLVACGGTDLPNVEIYDIADDQWTLIQDGVLENNLNTSAIVLNDKVYVIGGCYIGKDGTMSSSDYVSCVDVDNGTVDRVSWLPLKVSGHACALLTVPNTAA